MELEEMLQDVASKENVEICRTVSELARRLRMPLCDCAIVVLFVSDEKDLQSVLAIQPLLADMRIVLILPDRNDETIEAGHSLHPRYLSFTDNGLKDLKAVNPKTLAEAKVIREITKPLVILGRGEIKVPLKVSAHRVSKSAKEKIEKAGDKNFNTPIGCGKPIFKIIL